MQRPCNLHRKTRLFPDACSTIRTFNIQSSDTDFTDITNLYISSDIILNAAICSNHKDHSYSSHELVTQKSSVDKQTDGGKKYVCL